MDSSILICEMAMNLPVSGINSEIDRQKKRKERKEEPAECINGKELHAIVKKFSLAFRLGVSCNCSWSKTLYLKAVPGRGSFKPQSPAALFFHSDAEHCWISGCNYNKASASYKWLTSAINGSRRLSYTLSGNNAADAAQSWGGEMPHLFSALINPMVILCRSCRRSTGNEADSSHLAWWLAYMVRGYCTLLLLDGCVLATLVSLKRRESKGEMKAFSGMSWKHSRWRPVELSLDVGSASLLVRFGWVPN